MAGHMNVIWIHGSQGCMASIDPPLQVHQLDANTFVLRQGKCSAPEESFEAPFLYLLFGEDRALLLDTGASQQVADCPVGPTVRGIIDRWLVHRGRERLPLVVAHSHSHDDHAAGDAQFAEDVDTTIVPLGVAGVAQFFGIDWPDQQVTFDLGERTLDVIPLPGHEPSHVALYDRQAGLLLTGDSLYPGLLVVNDWNAYRASIARLRSFAESREVRFILGGHIEMTAEAGRWFGLGVPFQPGEHVLQLEARHLAELDDALQAMPQPRVDRHADFIIYPRGQPLPSLAP